PLSPMPPAGGTFRQGCRKVFCAKIGFGEIIKPDLIWILHTFNSHMRYRKSGSATLPNPIFYLLLYFPCLGKKILHCSVLIIPQTLHGAVREPVRTQQRHDHPPKTGKVACFPAIGCQTTTIFCTVQATPFKGPLNDLPCVLQGI